MLRSVMLIVSNRTGLKSKALSSLNTVKDRA